MIEMMVVVAIVGIMTSIIVWNYGDFRSGIIVTNMAYEAATSVRQAQLYGLGVRGAYGADGYEFGGTYGVEFRVGESTYNVFRDAGVVPDGLCEDPCACDGGDGECVERVTMLQNVTVAAVCATSVADSPEALLAACENFDILTVTYTRPRPEASIMVGSSGALTGDQYAIGALVLRGGKHCRLVTVYQSGQVSVSGLPNDTCGQ